MEPIIEKAVLTIVGILVSGLVTWLSAQIVKYRKLVKKEEDETVKNTIVNTLTTSLQPIQNDISTLKTNVGNMQSDIGKMKKDIKSLQNSEINFTTRLNPMQDEIEHMKDDITVILEDIKQHGVDLSNINEKEKHLEHETRCAWRYRIRTLCHAYIKRGWMSHEEFSQLQEMFNLYTAIGGNGQTKELYEKTMQLDIKTEAEIAAMEKEENKKQGAY